MQQMDFGVTSFQTFGAQHLFCRQTVLQTTGDYTAVSYTDCGTDRDAAFAVIWGEKKVMVCQTQMNKLTRLIN